MKGVSLRLQRQLASYKLLIVDELGYVPFSPTGAELLFEIFSQRYERGSIIVTSNLPFDEWTNVFASERLTGALLDRLTHHVHILEMNGDASGSNTASAASMTISRETPAKTPLYSRNKLFAQQRGGDPPPRSPCQKQNHQPIAPFQLMYFYFGALMYFRSGVDTKLVEARIHLGQQGADTKCLQGYFVRWSPGTGVAGDASKAVARGPGRRFYEGREGQLSNLSRGETPVSKSVMVYRTRRCARGINTSAFDFGIDLIA